MIYRYVRTFPLDRTSTLDNSSQIDITLASSLHLVTSVVGFMGAIMLSRTIVVCYTVLLLPNAAALLAIGCVAYQRHAFSLSAYLSRLWAQLDGNARDVIQGTVRVSTAHRYFY